MPGQMSNVLQINNKRNASNTGLYGYIVQLNRIIMIFRNSKR